MTDHAIRLFSNAAAIRRVGEGLLACTLPKSERTHEAHLAACIWLILKRPDIASEPQLPAIIRAYNVATGVMNDDTQGYHETLTQLYIIGVRRFLADCAAADLAATVNALLASKLGQRDWPFGFYSRELLFSTAARGGWTEPDIAAISLCATGPWA